LLSFPEKCVFAFWRQDPKWRISAILDFRGQIMGSLKSAIALNCLVLRKSRCFCILATDRQINEQMDTTDALSRYRCCEWWLNNV